MLKNGLIQGSFLVFQVLIRSFSVGWLMSALGQQQPFVTLPPDWLVSAKSGRCKERRDPPEQGILAHIALNEALVQTTRKSNRPSKLVYNGAIVSGRPESGN